MKRKILCIFFAASLGLITIDFARGASSTKEELSETWDEIGRALRDWADRARDYFSFSVRVPPREERPLISLMLRNRDKLGLSQDQVRKLERYATTLNGNRSGGMLIYALPKWILPLSPIPPPSICQRWRRRCARSSGCVPIKDWPESAVSKKAKSSSRRSNER